MMDERCSSDLLFALYANLMPDSPSSDLSMQTPSYASVSRHHHSHLSTVEGKKTFDQTEFRQNIYVNLTPTPAIYMNLPSFETGDQDEVNLVPSCRDKSELYRQEKMPLTIAPVCPILINTRSRRHRRPRLVHRYPGHPRVRTRVRRPQSRRTSHSVQTPVPSLRRAPSPLPSTSSSDEDEEPARPIPRSLSENIPIDREDRTSDDDEFVPHETFEDFLFRRRIDSSTSSSSSEESPPTPPRPQRNISKRYARGMTLGLEETDVNFIDHLIRQTVEEREICNRIAALRQAYHRAALQRLDRPRESPLPIVHPWISERIRSELEKYDEVYDIEQPTAVDRLKHFLCTIKRRAQENFQHWKKNFRTFRTRLIMESIPTPSHHRHRYYHTTDLRRMHRSQTRCPRHAHHRPVQTH